MHEIWDLLIVGGGASGITAAIAAARMGDRVLILEKSSALGRKIAASGNGRCNLMNTGKPVYYGDLSFVHSVLDQFTIHDLTDFFYSAGLFLAADDSGRIYPRTLQSSSVLDALKTLLHIYRVKTVLQAFVTCIKKNNNVFSAITSAGTFQGKRILIAAGGMAYPKLGGTDSGYKLLESFNHRIIQPSPALCPICTDSRSVSGLSGIRIRGSLSLLGSKEEVLYSNRGEILFTEYGISGICAMQCARFINSKNCKIRLDLAENLFPEKESLAENLLMRRKKFAECPAESLLNGIVMPKLSFAVLKQAGISLRGRTISDLAEQEILHIADMIHSYTLQVTGTRGFEEAQVTAGGADCSEFDPSNMESRIVKGLFASGEVLNIDGDCGGFNLMFAFISGILAGKNKRAWERDS